MNPHQSLWHKLILTLLLICAGGVVSAEPLRFRVEPEDYPTVAALENAVIPVRDRVDLARRLMGLVGVPAPPTHAPEYRVGDKAAFNATNTTDRRPLTINATLRALGQHVALWVEDGSSVRDADLQALANAFDKSVYPNVRALWGEEANPGVDGDPRVHGLFAGGLGNTTAAYFASDHTLPRAVYPLSNEREMFFFNLDALAGMFPVDEVESVVAHEFQHMIRQNIQPNDDTWLNEGISEFTQFYLYGSFDGAPLLFLYAPETQLTDWNADPALRGANYGAAQLFMIYLYDRFGIAALQTLSADPSARAWTSVDHVVRANGAESADAVFADWAAANLIDLMGVGGVDVGTADGGYESVGPLIAAQGEVVSAYPYEAERSLPPYGTHYYQFVGLEAGRPVEIALSASPDAPLIPAAVEGHILYSSRADLSDSRATRLYDLSGVGAAALEYRVWYDLETEWDYGYVMVSRDGERWEALAGEHMTTRDPNQVAYGAGYTGASEGWIEEAVALDGYAGAPVWVRFEVITDDAINRPGMAVDDVRVEAVGETTDFEDGDDGWIREGWVRTDNRVPARFYVQAFMVGDEPGEMTPSKTRWETQGDGRWLLDVPKGVGTLWLAVSPVAPVTTTPLDYSIAVRVVR